MSSEYPINKGNAQEQSCYMRAVTLSHVPWLGSMHAILIQSLSVLLWFERFFVCVCALFSIHAPGCIYVTCVIITFCWHLIIFKINWKIIFCDCRPNMQLIGNNHLLSATAAQATCLAASERWKWEKLASIRNGSEHSKWKLQQRQFPVMNSPSPIDWCPAMSNSIVCVLDQIITDLPCPGPM